MASKLKILTIAELHPNKDLGTAIRAAALLPRDGTWLWEIIGDGEEKENLKLIIENCKLQNLVVLRGFIPNASSLLPSADIAVLTSVKEGLPYFLLEAGAAGRAVVATRVGGVAEIIDDGVSGYLVPAGDPPALAARIADLLAQPARRQNFGAALAQTIGRRFSLATMLRQTLALYQPMPKNSL